MVNQHRGEIEAVLDGKIVTPDELVDSGEAELFTLTRAQETELPAAAKLLFVEGDADYRQAAVEARRRVVNSERVASTNLPIAMSASHAQATAETWLQEAWVARETASFTLPPSRMALEPTDLLTLDIGEQDFTLRLTAVSEGYAQRIDAKGIDAGVFEPTRTPVRRRPFQLPSIYGKPTTTFLDLPLLRADFAPHVGYVAATAEPWPRSIAFHRSPTTTGYRLNTITAARATMGMTDNLFFSGPVHRFDRSNQLFVTLDYGELESVTEEALLNGANFAALENDDGEWEVLQFMNADLVAPAKYRLTAFLRGQFGTEGAMRNPLALGARFVLLDSAVTAVDMTPDEVGLALSWKYGPSVTDIDDASYVTATHAFAGIGLRPLSPVHLQGKRNPANGDWTFSWTRRTRVGGDSWQSVEVPLGEDAESYLIEILDGDDAVRTVELGVTTFH